MSTHENVSKSPRIIATVNCSVSFMISCRRAEQQRLTHFSSKITTGLSFFYKKTSIQWLWFSTATPDTIPITLLHRSWAMWIPSHNDASYNPRQKLNLLTACIHNVIYYWASSEWVHIM